MATHASSPHFLRMKRHNHLVQSRQFASGARSSHKHIIRALSIATWIIAVFLSLLFYLAVRLDYGKIDWLAILLLGMIILGWMMVVYYYHISSTDNH